MGLALLCALALFGFGYWVAAQMYRREIADIQRAASVRLQILNEQYRTAEHQKQRLTDQLALTLARLRATETRVQTQIQQEVARYAQTHPDRAAQCIDAGWLRLHDAAATGHLPQAADATGGAAAAAVTAGAALGAVTRNYALARTCASRLAAWQQWYQEVMHETTPSLPR